MTEICDYRWDNLGSSCGCIKPKGHTDKWHRCDCGRKKRNTLGDGEIKMLIDADILEAMAWDAKLNKYQQEMYDLIKIVSNTMTTHGLINNRIIAKALVKKIEGIK
jgi:hypothetical protein